MAGFFLIKDNEQVLNLDKALNAFTDNGLRNPSKYQLGKYTLYLYNKLTAKNPDCVETEHGLCAAVGAYVYKGLNYHQSLVSTLEDYRNGTLAFTEMYGQYTLILFSNNQLVIVSDALSSKHIFSNREYQFFTSSFFAATEAIGKVTINDMAVMEKILSGIIISPDTLVNEVIQMNRQEQEKANERCCGITFLTHPRLSILPEHNHGKKQSMVEQAQNIVKYFYKLKPALEEDRIDLGLSAGHDSSLVFAAITAVFRDNIHIHTHSTGHVHDKEKNAAIAMAKVKGLSPTVVSTPRLDEAGIDLQKLLEENLVFFDGRTSHDIGGFSATYRAEYRMMATDRCLTTLSGVGGECLRNHYSVRGRKINADCFFNDKVFNRSFIEAAPNDIIQKVRNYHLEKAEKILGCKLRGRVKHLNLRRYYSEILMADGQGNVIDAYNTVSKCIAPFLDPHILQEAYRGIRYLGNCGEYESGIICALDPSIGACINSNNGYPFDSIPLGLRIKEAVRASVSSKTWEMLNNMKTGGSKKQDESYFFSVLNKSKELSDAYDELKKKYPDVDFDIVIKGYEMDALVEYLALTVRKLTNEV